MRITWEEKVGWTSGDEQMMQFDITKKRSLQFEGPLLRKTVIFFNKLLSINSQATLYMFNAISNIDITTLDSPLVSSLKVRLRTWIQFWKILCNNLLTRWIWCDETYWEMVGTFFRCQIITNTATNNLQKFYLTLHHSWDPLVLFGVAAFWLPIGSHSAKPSSRIPTDILMQGGRSISTKYEPSKEITFTDRKWLFEWSDKLNN